MQLITSLFAQKEINEHFKQSKSLLILSQSYNEQHHILCSKCPPFEFRHKTSLMLIAPLVTHSPRSTTTVLVLSCPRFTQPRQEFVQFGPFPSFSRKL